LNTNLESDYRRSEANTSMSGYSEAKHAFAINPVGPVPYSGYQVFGIFIVAFSPLLALTACGLRVYSRRLSQGLGLGEQGNSSQRPKGCVLIDYR
jgi:hypothetical protein